jgi:hypothetical protein
MATWTTIPDSSLEPGKPIRSIDGLALRDNPVAIAEGAAGAPRIAAAALQTGTPERNWVLNLTAGASAGAVGSYAFLRRNDNNGSTTNNTVSGSLLRYSGAWARIDTNGGTREATDGAAPAGTWRLMGQLSGNDPSFGSSGVASLWLRIS